MNWPMKRSLSSALSLSTFALVAAATTILSGCISETDDVYTADEQRPHLGAIARGEARFPLPVGTIVPDANGVATPLTASMEGVRLELQGLIVDGTCDSDRVGNGEFYYEMDLNGRPI